MYQTGQSVKYLSSPSHKGGVAGRGKGFQAIDGACANRARRPAWFDLSVHAAY
jgi:hypothetical protein